MRKNLLHALALSIPILFFFAGYLFNHSNELRPTGFIQYDNVSYVAYGKQYIDADKFQLQYSNPFNDHNNYQPIYFQTQTLLFALLLKLGVPPGWILIPFTIICSIICMALIIRIYDHIMPDKRFRTFNTWLFAWGGGLLTIGGFIALRLFNEDNLDPEGGWWGLSFGRALFFSCEAYYHALFLGCIYSILKRRWISAVILMLLLSISHPFTGLELAAIVTAWCVFEFLFKRNEMPLWFGLASVLILGFHVYYYLIYLEQFPDHQSVSEQYTLRWRLGIYRIIPAYCIVGALTIITFYKKSWKEFLKIRSNRIFLSWFVMAFLLSNHEIFMTARQPIHFTRGYIWTSLFLLGLPALQMLNEYLKKKGGYIALTLFAFVFLFDNLFWIAGISLSKPKGFSTAYITKEHRDVFRHLDSSSTNQTLIISRDNTMAYLSAVFTKAYPWYSHPYTTPFAEKKLQIQNNFFEKGIFDTGWLNRDIRFVLQKKDSIALSTLHKMNAVKETETPGYLVYRYRP